jgi:hypothetical protein
VNVPAPGVSIGDHVLISAPPAITNQFSVSVTSGTAPGNDFLRLVICNPSGAQIDLPLADYSYVTINQ